MVKFIADTEVSNEIRSIFNEAASNDTIYCAVAFWGSDAIDLISNCKASEIHILCNFESGATNPKFVSDVKNKIKIRNKSDLHAKVYLLDGKKTVVGSANASSNGLSLEGAESRGWAEACILLNDSDQLEKIKKWFDEKWKKGTEITDDDITRISQLWEKRRCYRPTITFQSSRIEDLKNILVSWSPTWKQEEFIQDDDSLRNQGYNPEQISSLIDESIELEDERDETLFMTYRWALWWPITLRSQASRSHGNMWEWQYTGKIIRNAGHYNDEEKNYTVVIRNDQIPPVPFDLTEIKFRVVFSQVISKEKYSCLRKYENFSFTETLVVLPDFWREVIEEYNK